MVELTRRRYVRKGEKVISLWPGAEKGKVENVLFLFMAKKISWYDSENRSLRISSVLFTSSLPLSHRAGSS